jgi:hypothetical protein
VQEQRPTALTDEGCVDPMPWFHRKFDSDGKPYAVAEKADWTTYLFERACSGERTEILHVGDLHVPLHHDALLDLTLRRHRAADLLIVAGDALEVYAYSRFPKRRNIPFEREIEEWARIQDFLSRHYAHVVILGSNHLDRIYKVLHDGVPTSLRFLVEPDLMAYLAQPLPQRPM